VLPETSRLDVRLVPAAVAAWVVSAAGIAWGAGPWLAALCVVLAVGWWLAGGRSGRRRSRIRAAAAGVLGAAVIGAGFGISAGLRSEAVRTHPIGQRFGTTAWVTVKPVESPRRMSNGRLMIRADLLEVSGSGMPGTVVVFASAGDYGQLGVGQPARFPARISPPTRRDFTVAVLTATGRPTLGRASAVQRAAQSVRDRFAVAAREVLAGDQAAILPGLVLGDTSAVTDATTAQFRTAGLTHLTAVSGANVTIVCGAVLLTAQLVGPRSAVGLAALALAVFVVVVQPTASVLRAAVMGAIALLAMLSGRRRQAIPVLAATVIALMVAAPQLAVDLGFALSVFATAALVVVAPVWSQRLVTRGWPKPLADGFSIALAAQLVTAPLVAAISGRLSLVAVLANLVVAPIIPPITILGTAAAALAGAWPAAAGLLIRFTGPEVWWLLWVAEMASSLPGAAVPVPAGWAGVVTVGGAAVAVVASWRWRWFRLTASGFLLCAAAWSVSGVVSGP